MKIESLTREFKYNGVKLADPNPAFTITQVRDFFATVYPEIISADIEGPEQIGAKAIYSFRRAVGTKGHDLSAMVHNLGDLLHANWLSNPDAEFIKTLQERLHSGQVASVDADDKLRLISMHREYCEARTAA